MEDVLLRKLAILVKSLELGICDFRKGGVSGTLWFWYGACTLLRLHGHGLVSL